MANKYTTSVNILRDANRDISYIPTPNAIKTVEQICSDFEKGIRSINIIGSYGTGKSSFLWALQHSVKNKKSFFNVNLVNNANAEFINIVGEFKSITEVFAEYFSLQNDRNLFDNLSVALLDKCNDLGKKHLLIISIDEFGKFLEFAANNEPEKELYFLQQLAEFCNNTEFNMLLLTTVHQNFDAYSYSLSHAQKQEWTKVKGRFREITFNEPIEQLLFLASEHIEGKLSPNVKVGDTVGLFNASKINPNASKYIDAIATKLYPLDIFAANIITSSIQKYGQNERSLFSFLEATDDSALQKHIENGNGYYSIDKVFDYLIYNFYTFINSKYNPDFAAWKSILSALDNVDRSINSQQIECTKTVKIIGLLNISSATGAILNRDFLCTYLRLCCGIEKAETIVSILEKSKIIAFKNYINRYVLSEGTDLDIESAIINAADKVSDVTDVCGLIQKYYQLPAIIAKEASYKKGTPRLFEYRISDFPIHEVPKEEIDGFINLLFNDKLSLAQVKFESNSEGEAILYCYYKNAKAIKDLLFEIEKTRKVLEENLEDKVAVRELNTIVSHLRNLLNHKILNNFHNNSKDVVWVFKGEEIKINSKKEFNKQLSKICEMVFPYSPYFNNELVNKFKISTSIHTAKRNYFKALSNDYAKANLGFADDKFPPEKTIYLSLLAENGIDLSQSFELDEFVISTKNDFNYIWNASKEFIESAKVSRRKISDLNNILSQRPYKLKQGLIDFFVPTFLFIHRNNFALFGEAGYIPFLNVEVMELMTKVPDMYEIKSFSLDGVKLDIFNSYRAFLEQDSKDNLCNASFIETIKPFLVFYKGLPEYTKNTKRLSNSALNIREAIAKSKDPEQTFFEDFPNALGYSFDKLQKSSKSLEEYAIKLQDAIRELRTCYEGLIDRIEHFIQEHVLFEEMDFEAYKMSLQNRFLKIRKHLLLPDQKTFVTRVNTNLDDRNSWLNNLVQALNGGNSLEKLKDEEEAIVCDKFKDMVLDLDNMTNLSKGDFSEDKEDVISLEISSFVEGVKKRLIRLPKNKQKEVKEIQDSIASMLSDDKTLNLAALTNLLKEVIKK
jgi:hypothetical protein